MSLFSALFGHRPQVQTQQSWETLTAYRPAFTTWDGQLYENELIRAAVDVLARHTSKLSVGFEGASKSRLKGNMRVGPNEWQTWPQFLYRVRTIYEMNNNCFIVPILDMYGEISGYYPVLPSQCEVVQVAGKPYLKYRFNNGKTAAVEMEKCCVLIKHQYKDDIFGSSNEALRNTMNLVTMQSQGIQEGIKNSATFRFMGRLTNFTKPEDLRKERERFDKENFRSGSHGGMLLFPNTYTDIKQIEAKPYVVDADQMRIIQENVFNYFGVNMDILQNKCVGDAWDAFYEGAIEPFAIQFSDGMTKMTYTGLEIARGNCVAATSNRLQYASTADKLAVSSQLLDRGILNRDEVRAIWNLPPIPDGEGQNYLVLAEYVDPKDQTNDDGGDSDADETGQGVPDDAGTGNTEE